jgi:hypothetical protein
MREPVLDPVNVQQALRKQPHAILLHKCVVIAEGSDHELSLSAVNGEAMGHAISLSCTSVAGQLENRGLSREWIVATYLFRSAKTGASSSRESRLPVFGVHGHHEVRVWAKQSHLALRITAMIT